MNNTLLIFIKNLEKGKVKTRLASTLGDEKALAIYKALLDHTRKIAQSLEVNRLLFYSNYIIGNDEWPAENFDKQVQEGSGLGDKMSHAFEYAFQKHGKVIIIGSDCASLTSEIVDEAFQLLNTHPFVIGPAIDGGYYLLGMNYYAPEVFKNIEWSTSSVFQKTIEIIKSLDKTYALLPKLSDIDFEEDWEKYGWEI